MNATCALQLLESAQKAGKKQGLSDDEQLLFVSIKATKVFFMPRTTSPHMALFMLLTGRSQNWWYRIT